MLIPDQNSPPLVQSEIHPERTQVPINQQMAISNISQLIGS